MTDLTKVAVLVNKLLALSKDGGATEAEARLAAEKAQALMEQHNLSMAHIEATGGSSGDEGQRVKDGFSHRQVYKWQRTLMAQIAELNFCFCREEFETRKKWNEDQYRTTRTSVFNGYQIIGRAANVVSTKTMFEYLVHTIERLAREDVKDPAQFFTRYAHSFKEGCSDRITERLQQRRQEEVEAQERKKREQQARTQHPASAGSTAVAIYLGDYVQGEIDANTDLRNGREPGVTRQQRLQREARDVERQLEFEQRSRELRMAMPDASDEEIYWRASGFSEETIQHWLGERQKEARPETDAQRRKREAREERENERNWRRYQKQRSRLDGTGYTRGASAGDNVGLDRQIDKGDQRKIN